MRIGDWSSDVCSSVLAGRRLPCPRALPRRGRLPRFRARLRAGPLLAKPYPEPPGRPRTRVPRADVRLSAPRLLRGAAPAAAGRDGRDRMSCGEGKGVAARMDLGCQRVKKKTNT